MRWLMSTEICTLITDAMYKLQFSVCKIKISHIFYTAGENNAVSVGKYVNAG